MQGASAIGGAHEEAFALHGLGDNGYWGIAEIKTIELGTTSLAYQQTLFIGPSVGLCSKFIQISEGLNRFCTVVQGPGNGGGGAQDIDDNSGVRTIWTLDGVWHVTSNVEIGNLHGHDLDQRASQ